MDYLMFLWTRSLPDAEWGNDGIMKTPSGPFQLWNPLDLSGSLSHLNGSLLLN
jgi:hypothetical protein